MLIDKTKDNPFGAAVTPNEQVQGPVGVMIDAPQNIPMAQDPSMVEQGVGILKGKATDVAVDKATGAATTMAEKALMGGAGKGGAAGGMVAGPAGMPVAAGAAKTGLMAAAPMAAPLVIGGLLAAKLLK